MLFFMCCYYGVYPWRVLLPRSTKTAATVLVHVHSVRRTSVRLRLSIIKLRSAAAETDLRRGVLQGRRAPVACKSSPSFTFSRNLKIIRCILVCYRPLAASIAQIAKNRGASPLTTSQRLPGVAWIIIRPARGENAISEGTPRAPKALQ